MHGYHRETTPYLDSLSNQIWDFQNGFATGPGTSVSFPSIFGSTYPFDFGGYKGFGTDRQHLCEILREEDLVTKGFHSNPYLSEHHQYNRGFDVFEPFSSVDGKDSFIVESVRERLDRNSLSFKILKKIYRKYQGVGQMTVPYTTAEKTTDAAMEHLQDIPDSGQFTWIHYMDPHAPHRPPTRHMKEFWGDVPDWKDVHKRWKEAKWNNSFTETDLELFQAGYDAEIRYVDEQIERLVTELSKLGVLDDTLIIITGDHGEEFMQHGDVSHTPKLCDELIHVPLLIYDPQADRGQQIRELVSLVDIAPTILQNYGIESPQSYRGIPLQDILTESNNKHEYVFSEVCHKKGEGRESGDLNLDEAILSCRSLKYKYIKNNQNNSEEFYNFSSASDDGCNNEDVPDHVKEQLRGAVDTHLQELYDTSNRQDSDEEIPDAVYDRISDLGYVE
jgi:arylsulfatase A-like enzyme